MARLNDRGQLLLIGAIVLAVTFVSLSVVLNGSIHTTAVAAEASDDVSAGESVALQRTVRGDVARVLEAENEESSPTSSDLSDRISVLDGNYAEYYARQGRVVSVTEDSTTDGQFVSHSSGDFQYDEDGDDSADTPWQPVDDGRFRQFDLAVDKSALASNASGAFTIAVTDDDDDDSDTWEITIYESGGTRVDVESPTDSVTTCTASASTTDIDLTAATVEGDHCNALDFYDRTTPPYTVEFRNADQVAGSFSYVVEAASAPDDSSLVTEDRIYSVSVEIEEHSPAIDYVRTIRVAPGEPS